MPTTSRSLNFGSNYAILNLDWMAMLINSIKDVPEGQAMIANCTKWNDAVHLKIPRPLTIFSTLSFSPNQAEAAPDSPFARLIAPFGDFTQGTSPVQIYDTFTVDEKDVVVQKTRWAATTGSALEQILKAQNIRAVVISGLSLSGVVMSTIYRLFDLDYEVYVIRDNVLELPVDQTESVAKVMLDILLPKMGFHVITLAEALHALDHS
ncbi:cysteine hydrolase family protein [Talaromyces stipitatus ATCC 10500]|uniref:Cysteine hydrolase family protein n=1 Tax=Talaromyces stipitatus (strain ATCC 10500 / CBS 375.48 / QM 6759 / NRRL 1006) TaxID=441959 RepID=B8M6F4_TALSN|nr:cysteine hydrolase family protein [Talaromyces stipitatus ATCC 10500]EED19329.1 cysteine hydrolase family protein [Talaromyces stipitatus ATCC 10500]